MSWLPRRHGPAGAPVLRASRVLVERAPGQPTRTLACGVAAVLAAACALAGAVPAAAGTGTGADLSLTLSGRAGAVAAGRDARVAVTLANAGPAGAGAVVVSLEIAPSLTFGGATPGQGQYVAAESAWVVGPLAPGGVAALEITLRPQVPGAHRLVAEVRSSDRPDPDSTPGNQAVGEDDRAAVDLVAGPPATPEAGAAPRRMLSDLRARCTRVGRPVSARVRRAAPPGPGTVVACRLGASFRAARAVRARMVLTGPRGMRVLWARSVRARAGLNRVVAVVRLRPHRLPDGPFVLTVRPELVPGPAVRELLDLSCRCLALRVRAVGVRRNIRVNDVLPRYRFAIRWAMDCNTGISGFCTGRIAVGDPVGVPRPVVPSVPRADRVVSCGRMCVNSSGRFTPFHDDQTDPVYTFTFTFVPSADRQSVLVPVIFGCDGTEPRRIVLELVFDGPGGRFNAVASDLDGDGFPDGTGIV